MFKAASRLLLLLRSSTFYFCARSILPTWTHSGRRASSDLGSLASPYPTINFSVGRDNEGVAVNGEKMAVSPRVDVDKGDDFFCGERTNGIVRFLPRTNDIRTG